MGIGLELTGFWRQRLNERLENGTVTKAFSTERIQVGLPLPSAKPGDSGCWPLIGLGLAGNPPESAGVSIVPMGNIAPASFCSSRARIIRPAPMLMSARSRQIRNGRSLQVSICIASEPSLGRRAAASGHMQPWAGPTIAWPFRMADDARRSGRGRGPVYEFLENLIVWVHGGDKVPQGLLLAAHEHRRVPGWPGRLQPGESSPRSNRWRFLSSWSI